MRGTILGFAVLGLIAVPAAAEMPVALLHSFSSSADDGMFPEAGVLLDRAGNLFGTTQNGGENGFFGTVFEIGSGASPFQLLHSFSVDPDDGFGPFAGLVLDEDSILYGTTVVGGAFGNGTVFAVKTDGSGFTLLHSFSNASNDGNTPETGLALDSNGYLYGTTAEGGTDSDCQGGCGTLYKLKTDGTGFTLLHSFADSTVDGLEPLGSVIVDGTGNIYGTTSEGGAGGDGTIFTIRTDGSRFRLLHSFSDAPADGNTPQASLVLDENGNLYGTTSAGGAIGKGTIFTARADGTGFTLLHSFSGTPSDGGSPQGALILDPTCTLVGTTYAGGASGIGTVFEIRTTGDRFTILHSFSGAPSDGSNPPAGLVTDGHGNYSGTTVFGGASDEGAVFTLSVPSRFGALVSPLQNVEQPESVAGR